MEGSLAIEIAGFGAALISSSIITAVSYGVMKEKVRTLERALELAVEESKKDRKDLRDEQKNFVTYSHFETVLQPIRAALSELKSDAKEILRRIPREL